MQVCSCATTNCYLKAWIAAHGRAGRCDYCHKDREWTVDEKRLVQYLDVVIRSHYTPDPQDGDEDAAELIQRLAGVSVHLARLTTEVVHDDENQGPTFYGYGPLSFRLTWPGQYLKRWRRLKELAKHSARFFGKDTVPVLEALLGKVTTFCQGAAIRILTPDDHVFRARLATSRKQARRWFKAPNLYLQAPPQDGAVAGRMNPAGVRVFYGALQESIALAEVRPPLAGHVVVGSFKPTRELTVLDLGALGDVFDYVDLFDPDFTDVSRRLTFLRLLEQELSLPIQPHDEILDYIPTQMFAEYVHVVLGLDGVAYRSTQAGEAPSFGQLFGSSLDPECRNVALFGTAALTTAESATTTVQPSLQFHPDSAQILAVKKIDISYEQEMWANRRSSAANAVDAVDSSAAGRGR